MPTNSPANRTAHDPVQPEPLTLILEPGSSITEATSGSNDVTIHLSGAQAQALLSSTVSARRGRDDSTYLAGLGRGMYGPDEVVQMCRVYGSEAAVEHEFMQQIWAQRRRRTDPAAEPPRS